VISESPYTVSTLKVGSRPLVKESSSNRPRLFAKKLSLVLVSLAFAGAIGEVVVRAFHLGNTSTVYRYQDKIIKFKPYARFMNYEENRNLVEMNNLGFHDHDRQADNKNYRILFMGDSYVEGRQVPTEDLFTVRLEKKIAAAGQKIETINGGVLGTGTAAQYVLWKDFFRPNVRIDRLVLCVFMGNDLIDNNIELEHAPYPGSDKAFFLDADGNIIDIGARPGAVKRLVNHGRDYSALFNTLYEGAYQARKHWQERATQRVPDAKPVVQAKEPDHGISTAIEIDNKPAWEASRKGTLARIQKWHAELTADHLAFDVVIIDRSGGTYNEFEQKFIDDLQADCLKNGIGCLRLKLTGNPYDTYSFDGKSLGHFNQRGHELAADELYEYFTRQGVSGKR
jgi:hypothetical protein